jgi:hypothetical protein
VTLAAATVISVLTDAIRRLEADPDALLDWHFVQDAWDINPRTMRLRITLRMNGRQNRLSFPPSGRQG